MHTFAKAARLSPLEHNQISGVKMVPCVGESPALSPWLLSCTGGGNMQRVGGSRQVRCGFIVTMPLAWRRVSRVIFPGLFKYS